MKGCGVWARLVGWYGWVASHNRTSLSCPHGVIVTLSTLIRSTKQPQQNKHRLDKTIIQIMIDVSLKIKTKK